MIMPTIRASIGRTDAIHLVELLAAGDEELRASVRDRLETDGLDALLDDPRTLNALLTRTEVKAPPHVVFYVLVRQALMEGGVDDRGTADYVASMILGFVRSGRAYRVTEDAEREYRYLVDIVTQIPESSAREAFLLRTHLGDFSLWLSGIFPAFIEGRVRRRGAPPIEYYERLGAAGYTLASESPEAQTLGVERLFTEVSDHFSSVRVALNRISDRYLFPSGGDPVDRLLRELVQGAV